MPAREVFFAPAQTKETSGSYTQIMIHECKKIGMKPVCDHKNYCKNDGNAFYIGQDHHVAHRGHRYNNGYFPSGWSEIKKHFDNMCMYTKNHGGHAKALCQNGGGHAWRTPAQNNKFMCAGLSSPAGGTWAWRVVKGVNGLCTKCQKGFQYDKKPGKKYGSCITCPKQCNKCTLVGTENGTTLAFLAGNVGSVMNSWSICLHCQVAHCVCCSNWHHGERCWGKDDRCSALPLHCCHNVRHTVEY